MPKTSPEGTAVIGLFQRLVGTGRMFDLAHPMAPGMPVFPQHIPYSLTLNRRHGDPHATRRPGQSSFANEVIVMSGHTATHIDALGHFSRCGCVHGNTPAAAIETHAGLSRLDAAEIPPIWRRGVMLDVARARGVAVLAPGDAIDAAELAAVAAAQGTPPQPGDVVLIRTGWARHWGDNATFTGGAGGYPGPGANGAGWLAEQGAAMVGSDTPAFEAIPFPGDSVHAMLLVDRAIHIIENLDLEELAAAAVHEFLFIGLPLRIVGGTGSPFRPLALA